MTPAIGNIALELFMKGGPVMWPILLCLMAALTVIAERSLWWGSLSRNRDRKGVADACEDISCGRIGKALSRCDNAADPVMGIVREGLLNAGSGPAAAMLVATSLLLEQAQKRLWLLGTFITMAPLLGLLGTVSGIMRSFSFVGDEALAVTKVSGGIAEALVATACGLGIAILCLIPYNYFNRRVAALRAASERAINRCEAAIEGAARRGVDIQALAAPVQDDTGTASAPLRGKLQPSER